MLVLSRRVGEKIVIGDDVVISVLELRGDVVRIGVDAPRHVQVRREELLAQLADTNREAATSPRTDALAALSRLVPQPGAQPATPPAGGPVAGRAVRPVRPGPVGLRVGSAAARPASGPAARGLTPPRVSSAGTPRPRPGGRRCRPGRRC